MIARAHTVFCNKQTQKPESRKQKPNQRTLRGCFIPVEPVAVTIIGNLEMSTLNIPSRVGRTPFNK